MLRKIDAMHHYYGFGVGICANCPHFAKKEIQQDVSQMPCVRRFEQ